MKVIEIGKGKNFHSCWEKNGHRWTSDFEYSYNPQDGFKSFTYQGVDYEYDEDTNRYYYLTESNNLRPEMDGAMVRSRIGKARYMEIYEQLLEYLGMNEEDTEETTEETAETSESEEPKTETTETATETEPETATDSEATEAETATDPEVGKFVYDVRIHNDYGWDTYTVRADGLESAKYKAVRRMELETGEENCYSIDVIRIYKEGTDELLKEIISKEREDPETADQGETAESDTKQYECENVVQVAHKVADLTNTRLDRQSWKWYCDEVKKDGSSWFDYTAFDSGGNEFDVSIFLGYDQQSRHYFVSVDYEKCPVPDMSGGD